MLCAVRPSYNKIAGGSSERIAALSDGIFAVAMTLLVLELHAPAREAIHGEHELRAALAGLAPKLLVYLMSFLTLGIFWVGQQTQLNHVKRANRDLSWIHMCFLFAVTLMPFSTALLGEHLELRTALVAYWLNILLLGVTLYWSWRHATAAKLVDEELSYEVTRAICLRILIGQSLYALGALLCIFSSYLSIAFIVLVQLNYAIAPRFGRKREQEEEQSE
jgi:uncharacterized membrane protein